LDPEQDQLRAAKKENYKDLHVLERAEKGFS
jgi:hypothetical protein